MLVVGLGYGVAAVCVDTREWLTVQGLWGQQQQALSSSYGRAVVDALLRCFTARFQRVFVCVCLCVWPQVALACCLMALFSMCLWFVRVSIVQRRRQAVFQLELAMNAPPTMSESDVNRLEIIKYEVLCAWCVPPQRGMFGSGIDVALCCAAAGVQR